MCFFCYWERWNFFFPKIWFFFLDGKRNTVNLYCELNSYLDAKVAPLDN